MIMTLKNIQPVPGWLFRALPLPPAMLGVNNSILLRSY